MARLTAGHAQALQEVLRGSAFSKARHWRMWRKPRWRAVSNAGCRSRSGRARAGSAAVAPGLPRGYPRKGARAATMMLRVREVGGPRWGPGRNGVRRKRWDGRASHCSARCGGFVRACLKAAEQTEQAQDEDEKQGPAAEPKMATNGAPDSVNNAL